METLMIIVSGVLVTVATYLLLTKNLMRIILGAAVLTHAVHLLIMAMGGFCGNAVPNHRRRCISDGSYLCAVDDTANAHDTRCGWPVACCSCMNGGDGWLFRPCSADYSSAWRNVCRCRTASVNFNVNRYKRGGHCLFPR